MAIEVLARVHAKRRRAREAVGRDEGAGIDLDAVDAVGVGRERPDARLALQRHRARQQELAGAAAAAALDLDRDRRLAARKQHARRRDRLARQRRVHLADLARLAFDFVAEDVRRDAGGAGDGGGGVERLLRRGDDVDDVAGERRVARLRRLEVATLEAGAQRGRHVDGVAVKDRERVGAGRRVGHGRAAADHRG